MEPLITAPAPACGSRVKLHHFVFGRNPWRTLCRVTLWGVLVICCFHKLLVPIQIIGSSMQPTYRDGSLNLVNRISYSKHEPHRRDVVAVNADGELLLKRIIALPGESVSIADGRIKVNGRPFCDEFALDFVPWEMEDVRLGADEYFVIGDNRAASVFGKVKKQNILGKTVF